MRLFQLPGPGLRYLCNVFFKLMKFSAVLDLDRGIINFFNGPKLIGSTIHQLTGDDWKTVDLKKVKIASNLWQKDGQWVVSAYPIDPKTGYIKLNRPYSIDLAFSHSAPLVAA